MRPKVEAMSSCVHADVQEEPADDGSNPVRGALHASAGPEPGQAHPGPAGSDAVFLFLCLFPF
jgi:hypothetical protein